MPRFKHKGADLYYELNGQGPPAVYINAYSGHSNGALESLIRQAFSRHYTLLAVDNRGAGQTIVDVGATITIDDMADDIAAILDHHQMPAAHLVGFSMGSYIAMTLALRHPDKVRSMVAASSAAYEEFSDRAWYMFDTWRELIRRDVAPDLINRFTAVVLLGDEAFQNEEFIQTWINARDDDPFAQTLTGAEQQERAVRMYDIRDRLSQITAPTLVMSSPEDIALVPRLQDELAAKIPNSEIKRYPGGHLFMALPARAPQFIADTLEFWRKNEHSS